MKNNLHFAHASSFSVWPLGDRALVIGLKEEGNVPLWKLASELALRIRNLGVSWIVDVIPAYDTVTIVYEPLVVWGLAGAGGLGRNERPLPYDYAVSFIEPLLAHTESADDGEIRIVEIPVCYGGEYGPDLADCAARSGLAEEAFIALHSRFDYKVAMIGFMPGFPYLTGLPEALAQPRRSSPRSRVSAGSVGIAGCQTGIYPLASPGGWQLIGRTPVRLFDPGRGEPSLLRAGDVLRFIPITAEAMVARGDG
ncbi:5-oxoprolinase subunit PxpB [Paenibacillus rhizovicinus]|uniref:5-oxoprolinase subunit PxpB n=1 Tax=Paenibacillus rhizovicinus TaxID=2704463 RepID=A0A6C0P4A9_9BACL|nr:5-oxoprolinase subunit PxpB [Paenibacillus rhizovicinus]QHW33329.1 5-oxoprolinase subunit PxpB [Paenibacillus rhizovicinus]